MFNVICIVETFRRGSAWVLVSLKKLPVSLYCVLFSSSQNTPPQKEKKKKNPHTIKCITFHSHLILFQCTFRHGLVSLLLKSYDDQSYEYVDKEEGKHHKVDHIKDGCLHAKAWTGTLVLICGIHRVLQDTKKKERLKSFSNPCRFLPVEVLSRFWLLAGQWLNRKITEEIFKFKDETEPSWKG